MTYKSILVYLETHAETAATERLALALAQKMDAHLTALIPIYQPSIPYYSHHALLADVLEAQLAAAKADAEALARTFGEEGQRQGVALECRVETCFPGLAYDLVRLNAHYNDLVIMTQPDPENTGPAGRHLPEEVLLAAARPVLVVPFIGAAQVPGRKILVAWDAGREAARAVGDALPFLRAAETVTVLSVEPKGGAAGHGAEPGADIARYLARQGCEVSVDSLRDTSVDAGAAIQAYIGDRDFDLLVMGAYGHSRLRELALGGVTQTIMEHMTIPTLAAH